MMIGIYQPRNKEWVPLLGSFPRLFPQLPSARAGSSFRGLREGFKDILRQKWDINRNRISPPAFLTEYLFFPARRFFAWLLGQRPEFVAFFPLSGMRP
jgi:hypothetical protein